MIINGRCYFTLFLDRLWVLIERVGIWYPAADSVDCPEWGVGVGVGVGGDPGTEPGFRTTIDASRAAHLHGLRGRQEEEISI